MLSDWVHTHQIKGFGLQRSGGGQDRDGGGIRVLADAAGVPDEGTQVVEQVVETL